MKKTLAATGVAVLVAAFGVGIAATTATAAPPSAPSHDQAVARADQAVSAHRDAIHGSSADKYTVRRVITEKNGASHVRFERTYHGLPVFGGDFVVHNAAGGAFAGADAAMTKPLTLGITPSVAASTATSTATRAFHGKVASTGSTRLVVDASTSTAKLAYETVVSGMAPDGQTPSKLHVLTDARSGAAIRSWDEIEQVNGTGNSIYSGTVTIDTTPSYSMVDPSHGNGRTCDMNQGSGTCTTFTDPDNTWGNGAQSNRQSAGVDAHFGAAKTFDYYKNTYGRNGIFGNGQGVPSRVHYGNSYINAFWDGAQMTYGDGASNQRPLVALDVAGHEMSHGVAQALANLGYSGDVGGINEANSDINGTMVEFYAQAPSDPGDYDIGEKININGNGTPLRYMYHPSLDGGSFDCWSSAVPQSDPHYSSGVGNHFFFLLAEGSGNTPYGNSPTCNSSTVTGINRNKAAAIWYRALDLYMGSNETYKQARGHTLQAATDLYGNCSTEYKAVQAAWSAVSVTNTDTPCGGTGVTVTNPGNQSTATGSSVSLTMHASGGTGSYTWSATGLPTGLSINSSSGVISGTASTAGTYNVTVTATSGGQSGSTSFTWTVSSGGGCSGSGQKLGNPGFESGTANWTSSAGVIGQWGGSGEPTHGGTWNAWFNGYGTTHTDTLSQSVTIPAGCTNSTLTFWLHIDTAETTTSVAYDTFTVKAGSTTLHTFSNLDKNTGYAQKSYNVGSFAGQTVTISFTGTEDVSLQTSFVIDDTALNAS